MKKYATLFLITMGMIFLCSCAAYQAIEADNKTVKDCEFIGTVSSTFKTPSKGKTWALEQAAEKGATHAIIKTTPAGGKGTGKYKVDAQCYICSGKSGSTAQ